MISQSHVSYKHDDIPPNHLQVVPWLFVAVVVKQEIEEKIFLALPQNYRGNQNNMAVLPWYCLQMIWWIRQKAKEI